MNRVEEIEAQVRQLPTKEAEELMDWLSGYLEAQAQLNPDFVASIERGQSDLREGRVRVRQP
jgi:hypothetical protein